MEVNFIQIFDKLDSIIVVFDEFFNVVYSNEHAGDILSDNDDLLFIINDKYKCKLLSVVKSGVTQIIIDKGKVFKTSEKVYRVCIKEFTQNQYLLEAVIINDIMPDEALLKYKKKLDFEISIDGILSSLYKFLCKNDCSIKEISRVLLEKTLSLINADSGYIFTRVENITGIITYGFKIREEINIYDEIIEFKDNQEFFKKLIHQNFLVKFDDNTDNFILKKSLSSGLLTKNKQYVIIPILSSKKTIGLMAFSRNHDFTDDDIRGLNIIAEYYSLVFQHKNHEQVLKKMA